MLEDVTAERASKKTSCLMMTLVLYGRFKDRITDMQTEVWMPPPPNLKDLIKTKYVIISKLGLVSSSLKQVPTLWLTHASATKPP